jgi:RNA polymerase sigma factor (sigma-70 family)
MGAAVRNDSGIQTYLKQISSAPLLTAEQEVELASAVQRNQRISEEPLTSIDELAEREKIEHDAKSAREQLVKCNLRLVVTIAKRFSRRGMLLADLIEEGNLGLIRAVESYDPAMNTRFSTYASWWIKQAIKRSLINSRQPVHIPAYMVELISKWKEATAYFLEHEGREPTTKDMADHLEVPERKVHMIQRAVKAYNSSRQSTSDSTDMPLSELLTDDRTPRPDEAIVSEAENAALGELLEQIEGREAQILRMRFGLDDGTQMTLKDIGAKIGLTRERVRQIERDALRKLGELMDPD